MRLLIVLLLPTMLCCAAAQPAVKSAPKSKKATKAAKAAAEPLRIPAAAVEIEPNVFRYTDNAGKQWIYRNTPFGVVRIQDAPEAAPAGTNDSDKYPDIKATDAGDSVRFERNSPFGPLKWERKKTELDEMERTVWERDQARAAQKD